MQMYPEKVKGVSHPLVNEMYLKKHMDDKQHEEDILVIETSFAGHEGDTEHDAYDEYMISLLSDLNELQEQARTKIGRFDRIDIRSHVDTHAH